MKWQDLLALLGNLTVPESSMLVVDVPNLGDLDRLFARIKREKGRLDIVVANAGVAKYAPSARSSNISVASHAVTNEESPRACVDRTNERGRIRLGVQVSAGRSIPAG